MTVQSNWPDPVQIALARKNLGITQQKLSKMSGVPQPVISRIEAGSIRNPSYHIVRRLFEALEMSQEKEKEKNEAVGHDLTVETVHPVRASDLMNKKLVSVEPISSVKDAWAIMRERGFSQLPVTDARGRVLGGISESSIASMEMEDILDMRVTDAMTDPFPIVGKDTKLPTIVSILKTERAVLVVERGRAVGIITGYDVIENVFAKEPSM